MAYRLRYLAHDLELPIGEFVVGRSTECQLSLDDPLVSRRHAVLRVRRDGVSVQDLGSRNGVLVNGDEDQRRARAHGRRQGRHRQPGDGAHGLRPRRRPAASEEVYRRATQTLGAAYVSDLRARGGRPRGAGRRSISPAAPLDSGTPRGAQDPAQSAARRPGRRLPPRRRRRARPLATRPGAAIKPTAGAAAPSPIRRRWRPRAASSRSSCSAASPTRRSRWARPRRPSASSRSLLNDVMARARDGQRGRSRRRRAGGPLRGAARGRDGQGVVGRVRLRALPAPAPRAARAPSSTSCTRRSAR